MARTKRGVTARARHKKVLAQAKGYYGARSRVFRVAKQAVIKAQQYAYRDRKQKRRLLRRLWIARINAATRQIGVTYGQFIAGLKAIQVSLNRKMLSELAISSPAAFQELVEKVRAHAATASVAIEGQP